MLQKSHLTGKIYNEDDVVFFRNVYQSAYYCLKGAHLVDLIPTDELKFVFVFERKDHQKYRADWEKRKYQNKKEE